METDAITSPTAIPRPVGIPNLENAGVIVIK